MRKYLQGQRQQGLDKVLLSVLPWILYLATLSDRVEKPSSMV